MSPIAPLAPRWVFPLIATMSVLVALGSWRFLVIGLELSFTEFGPHIDARPIAFLGHVIFSPIALAVGVFQFIPKLRARRLALHRWLGRVYVASVALGGLSGLWLAFYPPGGWVAGWGFALLALAWLLTTGQALRFAIRREIAQHRIWMIRSFALTLAGLTLRLYLPLFFVSGHDYVSASVWLAWICWVPNLLIAEWWITRTARRARVPA